jgi:hypothetical protein
MECSYYGIRICVVILNSLMGVAERGTSLSVVTLSCTRAEVPSIGIYHYSRETRDMLTSVGGLL